MTKSIAAVFLEGKLVPSVPLDDLLAEGQTVTITFDINQSNSSDPTYILSLARKVYDGLSEAEIAEVEAIALDRSNFFTQKNDDKGID